MKTTFASLVLFASVLFCVGAVASPHEAKDVTISASEVFVPGGFNSTTDAYVIVSGLFPNSCYNWSHADVNNATPFVHEIRLIAAVAQQMCLMVMIPFQKDVGLGRLEAGEHILRFVNGDGTYSEKSIKID